MIEIRNLSFGYKGGRLILDGLNMSVNKGSVYGFVGANGAGKSTTIRLLLRLLKAKKGKILIDGREPQNVHFEKIGFLIDNPVFYDHLTCFQNLKILQNYYPNIDNRRIEEVLQMVDLFRNKNSIYKNCSTGMKQRLGIAKAFIHQPELIILDEPLNGLDPEWVIYTRDLLVEINRKCNTTIFFTNHILSEVEKIATHIGILKAGRLVVELPMEEVRKANSNRSLLLTCESMDQMPPDIPGIPYQKINAHQLLFNISDKVSINDILSGVMDQGIMIKNIEVRGNDLETTFLNILK